ncbi:MAG: hypothetical protein RSB41_02655 [Bacilli bacterium]
MSFVYANPGSGPSAGGIGWFDFGNLTINPGQSYTGLTGTLSDGSTVTFDIKSIPTSFVPFTANTLPRPFSYFGSSQYTGLTGNPALTTPLLSNYGTNSTVEITNIVVKDVNNNIVPNFTAVVADAESTNKFPQYTEHLTFTTTGNPWSLLSTIGPNPPTIVGVGSNSVTITGTNQSSQAAYVLTSTNPTALTLETFGREAVSIGFSTTRITLKKIIGSRIKSSDQFDLSIAGTPNSQVFTSGSSEGLQTVYSTIYAIAGNTYTINELMKAGSGSLLTDYTVSTSAVNKTLDGITPPVGPLAINVTPQLGDDITYTITNAAPETFTKKVDKAYADLGDVLTYTVTIDNPNSFAVNNVLMSDPTPAGTTYVGNLLVSAPYTGTNPNTGITINTIPGDGSVTVSWQVKVNSNIATSQVSNVASVTVPGGTSGNTNIVKTSINNADLTSTNNFIKSVSPTTAKPGDTLSYTITLTNTGNVSANNVVVTDVIPAGTTYVAGSVTSSLPFTGDPTSTINLTSPIVALGTATITFKVKVGPNTPVVNPIPNTAKVDYAYTVDPANPNGTKKSGNSNTVFTNIVNASSTTTKSSDKDIAYIGDEIKYNINVTNTGNTPMDSVIISDVIPNGTVYIPGSLVVSAPYTADITTGVTLTNPILPGQNVTLSFSVKVVSIPNPNPIKNKAITNFKYTLNPGNPDSESGTSTSNIASTIVFRNNYLQEINDLIQSVALEEAALGNIANQEGAKIQAALAIQNITTEELMCINKSVQDMLDSINTLNSILKQKLNIVNCQISGCTCC